PGTCGVVAIAGVAAATWLNGRNVPAPVPIRFVFVQVTYGLVATSLILATVLGSANRVTSGALGNPVSQWLGEISYGIYLWHIPTVAVLAASSTLHSLPWILPVVGWLGA